jgi:hypothetical protein
MSGTTLVTQQTLSYVVQTVGSTGIGESPFNALETIDVTGIADDTLARVETTDTTYRWYQASLAAPSLPNVVIPLGQPLLTPGRWILVTGGGPPPPYYQYIESLPLLSTLTPEYGALIAVPQQSTLQFVNGDLSNTGVYPTGKSILTLHYQQVFFTPFAGVASPQPKRARLQFVAAGINPSNVPVIVTDDVVTDSTVVTVYRSLGTTTPWSGVLAAGGHSGGEDAIMDGNSTFQVTAGSNIQVDAGAEIDIAARATITDVTWATPAVALTADVTGGYLGGQVLVAQGSVASTRGGVAILQGGDTPGGTYLGAWVQAEGGDATLTRNGALLASGPVGMSPLLADPSDNTQVWPQLYAKADYYGVDQLWWRPIAGTILPVTPDAPTGVIDITRYPYYVVPNDRSKAAHNTTQMNLACVDALAQEKELWAPGGAFHFAKNGNGPDANGWTSAISFYGGPLTIKGAGQDKTMFVYCVSAGVYDCLIHTPESANPLTETGTHNVLFKDLTIAGGDTVTGQLVKFGIKSRLIVFYGLENVRITGTTACGAAFDFAISGRFIGCKFDNNYQHGLAFGAYFYSNNGNVLIGCDFIGNAGAGLFAQNSLGLRVLGGYNEANTQAGIILNGVTDSEISTNFEGNASGTLTFNGGAFVLKQNVCIFRGLSDATDPDAWIYTLDPNTGGAYYDGNNYSNNGGITLSNCFINDYTSGVNFVNTNAAYGLTIRDCQPAGANRNPALGLVADGSYGFAFPFNILNSPDLLPPELLSYAWGGSFFTIGETKISNVPCENLLDFDVIKACVERSPTLGGLYPDLELSFSTTASGAAPADALTYNGEPTYRVSGLANGAGKCMALDVDAHPRFKGVKVCLTALCYVPSLVGIWPSQQITFALQDGSNHDSFPSSRPYLAGWVERSVLVQLPTTGVVKLGFSLLGSGEAFMAKPAIHLLGAPYSEVIAGSNQPRGGRRRALNLQMGYITSDPVFNADGVASVAGIPVVVRNAANVTQPMEIPADGTGLHENPTTGTVCNVGSITAPILSVLASKVIPDYNPGMKVWVYANQAANDSAAGYNSAFLFLWDGGDMSGTSGGYQLRRGGGNFTAYWIAKGALAASAGQAIVVGNSNAVMVLVSEDVAHRSPQYYFGQMLGLYWPSILSAGDGADACTGILGMTSSTVEIGMCAQLNDAGPMDVTWVDFAIDYEP